MFLYSPFLVNRNYIQHGTHKKAAKPGRQCRFFLCTAENQVAGVAAVLSSLPCEMELLAAFTTSFSSA